MTALDQTPLEETPNVAQMRETIERLTEKVGKQGNQLKTQAFKAAGLDPSEGIGELLANAYEGEMTPEAVAEFAKSKGVTSTTEPPTDKPKERTPQEKLVEIGQKRLDGVHDESQPLSEPSIDDEIAAADKAGDFKLGISLRNAKQLAREQSGDYVVGQ